MNFAEIEQAVLKWAEDRKIFLQSNAKNQLDKLQEEFDELFDAVYTEDIEDVRDALGDMMVVMAIIAFMCGLNLTTCFDFAYNEIKDREGKMVDGIFVKEE